jgi:DNA polymerase-3 subunit delta'
MSLDNIIGQPLAVELIQRWLSQETNQPLLFYGPEGVGKRTTAIELAKALNCPKIQGLKACDHCSTCKRIVPGKHPDVCILDMEFQAAIRGEALEKQQTLRIETILEERRRLYQSSVEGGWKVSILDDAHRLTADAANVLLKVMEEPPARTAIFLLTPYRDRLFATLVSRCQPVRFKPLADHDMRRCLKDQQVPADQQMRLIELAAGSPGRALRLNRAEQIQNASEAETLWKDLPGMVPGKILARPESRSRTTASQRVDVEEQLQQLLSPALRALRSGQPFAARKLELIQEAQKQLRQNVPPSLVYDHLLLKLSRLSPHA